jgi:hypothetical protein
MLIKTQILNLNAIDMSLTLEIIVSRNSIVMANLLEHGAHSALVMGNSMAHWVSLLIILEDMCM